MADRIRVDPEALQGAMKRLATLNGTAQELLTSLQDATQPVVDGKWTGEAADAHMNETRDEVAPATKALVAALEEAGTKLGEISRAMQEAQQEASK